MAIIDKIKNFFETSIIFRPIRAMLIAYSFVWSGKKVVQPLRWDQI